MKKNITIFLVDDHQSTLNAYSNFINQFNDFNPMFSINIHTAGCCDSALELIKQKNNNIDIAFLDMRLPESNNSECKSGEDLAIILKSIYPNIKLVIITGYYETIILSNVIQKVNPDALVLKNDVDKNVILEVLSNVLKNKPYYSISVLNLVRKKLSSNTILDPYDKQILYELWQGNKTKDLVNIIPLSLAAIEKRKRKLKAIVNIKTKDDNVLINSILQKGFL